MNGGNTDESSLAIRLRGGGCSLLRTRLRANSLVTGKISGNFRHFSASNRRCSFPSQGGNGLLAKIRAGNFQRRSREFNFVNSEPYRESYCGRRTSEPWILLNQKRWNDQRILKRHLQPAARKLRLPFVNWRFLRNLAHATWLIQAGADPKSVQGQMRHSRISTTMDIYAQIVPSSQRRALQQLSVFASGGIASAALETAALVLDFSANAKSESARIERLSNSRSKTFHIN